MGIRIVALVLGVVLSMGVARADAAPLRRRGAVLRGTGIATLGLGVVLTLVSGLAILGEGSFDYNSPHLQHYYHLGEAGIGTGLGLAVIGSTMLSLGYRDLDAAKRERSSGVASLEVAF